MPLPTPSSSRRAANPKATYAPTHPSVPAPLPALPAPNRISSSPAAQAPPPAAAAPSIPPRNTSLRRSTVLLELQRDSLPYPLSPLIVVNPPSPAFGSSESESWGNKLITLWPLTNTGKGRAVKAKLGDLVILLTFFVALVALSLAYAFTLNHVTTAGKVKLQDEQFISPVFIQLIFITLIFLNLCIQVRIIFSIYLNASSNMISSIDSQSLPPSQISGLLPRYSQLGGRRTEGLGTGDVEDGEVRRNVDGGLPSYGDVRGSILLLQSRSVSFPTRPASTATPSTRARSSRVLEPLTETAAPQEMAQRQVSRPTTPISGRIGSTVEDRDSVTLNGEHV